MNRELKKYAEKQSIQYRNEEFLEELKVRQREGKKEHRFFNKKLVSLYASLGVVLATIMVVLLCVFLIKPSTTTTDIESQTPIYMEPAQEEPVHDMIPVKEYLEENMEKEDCDLTDVNNALSYISFSAGDHIQKIIDKKYKEILYYYFSYTSDDELVMLKFRVCGNPDYKMDGESKEYAQKGNVASYEIQYSETVNCDDDIYFFTESGRITTDREIILIDAEIIGFEENSNFIELLNEIIQEK